MKLNLNWDKKEIEAEADVEKVILKNMEMKKDAPPKKTRYQIKQEEKRKNEELKFKQNMVYLAILGGIAVFGLLLSIMGTLFGI